MMERFCDYELFVQIGRFLRELDIAVSVLRLQRNIYIYNQLVNFTMIEK